MSTGNFKNFHRRGSGHPALSLRIQWDDQESDNLWLTLIENYWHDSLSARPEGREPTE